MTRESCLSVTRFEADPGLVPVLNGIFDYWRENQPSLGHGFCHAHRVARVGYCLAIQNGHSDLAQGAYLTGLGHDIVRPVEQVDGRAYDAESARVTAEILGKSCFKGWAGSVAATIDGHDGRILSGGYRLLDMFLSLADKSAMSVSRTWAVVFEKMGLDGLGAAWSRSGLGLTTKVVETFGEYQTRARKVIEVAERDQIVGSRLAESAYDETLDGLRRLSGRAESDPVSALRQVEDWLLEEIGLEQVYLEGVGNRRLGEELLSPQSRALINGVSFPGTR